MAELDMTNSSQQCPSALRQRNDSNIHTCGTDPNVLCTSITFLVNFLRKYAAKSEHNKLDLQIALVIWVLVVATDPMI